MGAYNCEGAHTSGLNFSPEEKSSAKEASQKIGLEVNSNPIFVYV